MGKNSRLKPLSGKDSLSLLKSRGQIFYSKWLKAVYLRDGGQTLQCAWAVSGKASRAADRSRLRRWGRESLRKTCLKGKILVIFLPWESPERPPGEQPASPAESAAAKKLARSDKGRCGKGRRFYKNLRRKDFDHVFKAVLDKISKSSPARP